MLPGVLGMTQTSAKKSIEEPQLLALRPAESSTFYSRR